MKHEITARPCSVCLGSRNGLVSEIFVDGASAFHRHSQLVQIGTAPSFCRRRDGTHYVCHLVSGQEESRLFTNPNAGIDFGHNVEVNRV